MMMRQFAIGISLACLGCTTAPVRSIVREENLKGFTEKVKDRNLAAAARFAIFFENQRGPDVEKGDVAEVLSQYYLLTCQPQKAFAHLQQIPGERRTLYEAILYSLVSVERVSDAQAKAKAKPPPRPAVDGNVEVVWKTEEIWADEWASIKAVPRCTRMPIVRNIKLRAQLRTLALEKFKALPEEWVTTDLPVLALALDVGYQPTDPELLLAVFSEHKDRPYYRIIESLRNERNPASFGVANQTKAEISLTELTFNDKQVGAYEIEIPILVK